MITLLVIVVVIWTVIRIVQLAGWIWSLSSRLRKKSRFWKNGHETGSQPEPRSN